MSARPGARAVDAFVEHWGLERRADLLYLSARSPDASASLQPAWRGGDDWTPDEPSTIWTRLAVKEPTSVAQPPLYPTYRSLPPGQRSRYLRWLAGVELDEAVPEGYATLYYLGLERRCFGARRRRAWGEMISLRSGFSENFYLHRSCDHALVASGLDAGDWEGLADLSRRGVFDASEPAVKNSLLHHLGSRGVLSRPPLNWLVDAAGDRAEAGHKFVLARFQQEVETLLRRRSLRERLEEVEARSAPETLPWRPANRSERFPRPECSSHTPLLQDGALLAELRTAWKAALRWAQTDRMEETDRRAEESVRLDAVQAELFHDRQRYDVEREIRRAADLREKGRTAEARACLETLLGRAEVTARQRWRIKKMRERYRARP